MDFEGGQNPLCAAVHAVTHTHDEEEADEDDGEGAHAHAEDLLLLHELAVVAREAAGAEAGVALHRLAVDAGAAVVARVVQALVAVHARLAVGRHALPARTADGGDGGLQGEERKGGRTEERQREGKEG